jgi:hypothetical protein
LYGSGIGNDTMAGMLQKKTIEDFSHDDLNLLDSKHLNRCSSAFDLTLLGIGAVIGAGIFILTGIAAATQRYMDVFKGV